jgi:hypothetical protein
MERHLRQHTKHFAAFSTAKKSTTEKRKLSQPLNKGNFFNTWVLGVNTWVWVWDLGLGFFSYLGISTFYIYTTLTILYASIV